ncbi:hypothetical protein PFISCL1PPCAC_1377, partial [Pristionchus fissidentatus]
NQSIMLVFIIFFSLFSFVVSSPNFWITSQLVNIEWKEDCLTTRECSRPRFEIAHEIKSADQRFVQSISVSEQMMQSTSPFVSVFSLGSSDEVSISASVMGIDPVYAFPRVCDSTTPIRPFLPGDISARFRRVSLSDGDSKSIQVFGRCFTATIEVRRHMERCPWCEEEEEEKVEEKKAFEERSKGFFNENDVILVIALALIILILLITLIVVLTICTKSSSAASSSPPLGVYRPSSKSPSQSITSSGIFSISGSSIQTTVTIPGSPVENDYESIKGLSPIPSLDSGFAV